MIVDTKTMYKCELIEFSKIIGYKTNIKNQMSTQK